MKIRVFGITLLILCISVMNAQTLVEKEFNERLEAYVNTLLERYGEKNISKERFLIQQIRMINEEIKARVENVSEKRDQYFTKLETRLAEVRELKRRLPASGSQLSVFINDLEDRLEQTISNGVMDYKRQKVFDDAIQLLYLAEQLTKLDPGADVASNPQIAQSLNQANRKLDNEFGESIANRILRSAKKKPTIFDVYEEWQRTKRISYQVRLTDIQIIKKRLIKNATFANLERMLKRELRNASELFNFGYYKAAEMSFTEILESYNQAGSLDDVQFYKGESNYYMGRYNAAKEDFEKMVQSYSASQFLNTSFLRLMQISNHYGQYDQSLSYFRQLQTIGTSGTPEMEEALLYAIDAAFMGGFYQQAVNLSYEVDPNSPFYQEIQFMRGQALAGAQNLEEAASIFEGILDIKSLEPAFRFDVLAKLGFIYYELRQPDRAINYFNQIAPEYENFDQVLMGLSWANYKKEIDKVMEERNFTVAKKYLTDIINVFPNSDYNLEAHSLLGYISQLEFNTTSAISNYRYAYNAKDIKLLSDELNDEQDKLQNAFNSAEQLELESLQEGNLQAYERASVMKQKVEEPLLKLKYADLSPVGMAASNEVKRLKGQIDELERLKSLAIQRNEDALVERIEDMQLKIYRAINSYPDVRESKLGFNYFDEHPLARKESIVEHDNQKLAEQREEAKKERNEVLKRLARLDVEILNAKSRRDYKKLSNLEISKERFQDILKNLDYVETWLYSVNDRSTNINLDRWSDYGAFGLANVNFAIRKVQKEQIGSIQDQIQKINDLLNKRKDTIEHKIRQIDTEITLMTRRVRHQERIREREELNRQFEESYFDTHESEAEAPIDNTAPPSIDNTAPPSFEEEEE